MPARQPIDKIVRPDVDYNIKAYDPWEGFNRRMYKFNYYFDKYFFLPIVSVYEAILPDFLENRISSFFNNIEEITNFTNGVLQLKVDSAATTTARFIINSTLGLGGLFDPATEMGAPRQNEDFGQTLGHYGVGPGPYLVLPVLGPSSVRDTTGIAADAAFNFVIYNEYDPFEKATDKNAIEATIRAIQGIDKRHTESFRYYQTSSPFEYDLIRMLYLKKRQLDVEK